MDADSLRDSIDNVIADLGDPIEGNLSSTIDESFSVNHGRPSVVVFANAKGGVGKTTLAYEFARHAQRTGHSPLLIDLDFQCNLSSYALGYETANRDRNRTLHSFFWAFPEHPIEIASDERRFNQALETDSSGMPILLGHDDLVTLEHRMVRWSPPVLRYLPIPLILYTNPGVKQFDIVVIDTAPGLTWYALSAIMVADVTVTPLVADLLSIQGVRILADRLEKARQEFSRHLEEKHRFGHFASRIRRPLKIVAPMNAVSHAGAQGVAYAVRDAITFARQCFDGMWGGDIRMSNMAVKARRAFCSAFDLRDGAAHQVGAEAYRRELRAFCDSVMNRLKVNGVGFQPKTSEDTNSTKGCPEDHQPRVTADAFSPESISVPTETGRSAVSQNSMRRESATPSRARPLLCKRDEPYFDSDFPDAGKAVVVEKLLQLVGNGERKKIRMQGGSFEAWLTSDNSGIAVDNLDSEELLIWDAFYEAVNIAWLCGGTADRGNAMNFKLGEEGLLFETVEGWVASRVYGVKKGGSAVRRITPIVRILEAAKLVHNADGTVTLSNWLIEELDRKAFSPRKILIGLYRMVERIDRYSFKLSRDGFNFHMRRRAPEVDPNDKQVEAFINRNKFCLLNDGVALLECRRIQEVARYLGLDKLPETPSGQRETG